MVDFLNGLFSSDSRKAKTTEVVARATSGSNTLGSYSTSSKWTDFDRAVRDGYEKVTWVFRAVDAISKAQAGIPMKLRKYNYVAQGQEENIPRIDRLLNRRWNPYEDAWRVRYRLSSQLLLSQRGAFIEIVTSDAGVITALYLLPPGQVVPIKDPKKFVAGYQITRDDGQIEILPPETVVWLQAYPHPQDPYRQMTPLQASGLAAETDFLAKMFNRNFLRNDGRPGMLIALSGQIDPEDAMEIRNRFEGGGTTAGRTMVVEADDMKVQDMSSRPRDIQWDEALKGSKEEILGAFGVPETILGNAAGRCLRQSEYVHLASGQVKQAKELVGQEFELYQPTNDGIIKVFANASWDETVETYRITTFSGRTLETNGKHPLYMAEVSDNLRYKDRVIPFGWTAMDKIKAHYDKYDAHPTGIFTEVAVPMYMPQDQADDMDANEAYDCGVARTKVPDALFTANEAAQLAFINGLFSEHAKMSQHSAFEVVVPTFDYAKKLQRLLLRVGVYSNVTTDKTRHLVTIASKVNMLNFLAQIDLDGKNRDRANSVFNRLSTETMPGPVIALTQGLPQGLMWDRVKSVEAIGKDKTVAITVPQGKTYLSMFWEHNTFNNAASEVEGFWENTMKPHCDSIARGLDAVTGVVGDDLYVEYDYMHVPVLQQQRRKRIDQAKQDYAAGTITIDDYRKELGLPPLNLPGTRVLIHPKGVVIGSDDDVDAVSQLYVIGARRESGADTNGSPLDNPFLATDAVGDGTVGGFNDTAQQELAANGGDANQSINQIASRAMRSGDQNGIADTAAAPNANPEVADRISAMRNKAMAFAEADTKGSQRKLLDAFVTGSLSAWETRMKTVSAERLTHAKVRKGTRHWEGEGKGEAPLDADYVVRVDEWGLDETTTKSIESYLCTNVDARADKVNKVSELLTGYMGAQAKSLRDHVLRVELEGANLQGLEETIAHHADDKISLKRLVSRVEDLMFE